MLLTGNPATAGCGTSYHLAITSTPVLSGGIGWLAAGIPTVPATSYTAHSLIDEINTENVKNLKVAWEFSLAVNRGQEAPPIVVGSTMYVSTGYRLVALNAKTGAAIPSFGKDGIVDLKVGNVAAARFPSG